MPRPATAILSLLLLVTGCGTPAGPEPPRFVRVEGHHLVRDGRSYRFVGANLWYGANLGAAGPGGDRARLVRELDLLHSLGIDNLRVLGASEGLDQPNTVWPPIQPEPGTFDERLLVGLDFLLAEMARRDMVAVVYLTNYWEWSGGMAQYVSWFDDEPVPNPVFERFTWPQFMEFSARFYGHAEANAAYRRFIETLIRRRNTFSGVVYRDDPTIMAWQLANEPRPGHGETGLQNIARFTAWVGETAGFIRSLDANHIISTGNEGLMGCLESARTTLEINSFEAVDYLTAHLWVLNWSWYDPLDPQATYPVAETNAVDYLDRHIAFAEQLGKPLVLEEFGIPRDGHAYGPDAPTTWRDRYYARVFEHIRSNAEAGGPFAGSNFWGWGGYGRARDPENPVWRRGDDVTGDPPQEPQGRNSVFASDASTLLILKRRAAAMDELGGRR